MPSRALPLMTADERYEIAKACAKARAHCELAAIYLHRELEPVHCQFCGVEIAGAVEGDKWCSDECKQADEFIAAIDDAYDREMGK